MTSRKDQKEPGAGPKRPRNRSSARPIDDAAEVEALARRARETLAKQSFVAGAELGPARLRKDVVTKLEAEGFGANRQGVFVPAVDQLATVLADGAFVPLRSVGDHVQGPSATAAKEAALQLVESGRARIVLRTQVETLVSTTAAVFEAGELRALERRIHELSTSLKTIQRKKYALTLLRSDVAAVVETLVPPSKPAPRADLDHEVIAAIEAATGDLGLAFVPAVVTRLARGHHVDDVQRAMTRAASAGRIELRPESGMSRLSAEELNVCPTGPDGTRLSWARLVPNEAS